MPRGVEVPLGFAHVLITPDGSLRAEDFYGRRREAFLDLERLRKEQAQLVRQYEAAELRRHATMVEVLRQIKMNGAELDAALAWFLEAMNECLAGPRARPVASPSHR